MNDFEPRYTIIDTDSGEQFSTQWFEDYNAALRERNRLAIHYGKEFCLRVAEADELGQLREMEEP